MTKKSALNELFEKFNTLRVFIAGDVMLDRYIYGNVDRISPEAPVPVVTVEKTDCRLGGAANVAMNIKTLGATPYLFSFIGSDNDGNELISLLENNDIDIADVVKTDNRITTSKTRVISKNNQMLRYDREVTVDIDTDSEQQLISAIKNALLTKKPDVFIFEDYNKGILTEKLIREVTVACLNLNIPVVVDPKKNNFFAYQLCTLFKPNIRELKESLHMNFNADDTDSLNEVTAILNKQLHHAITMITMGDKGIYLRAGNEIINDAAQVRNVADVSGAGDTVISVAALCLAAKTSLKTLVQLANTAGGLVCEYAGVVPVNKEQLLQEALEIL